ncbi:growth hormone-regulated TBC protein 1 isoform X1 [Amblyraja radiata]|uniref:growth hormone-regulated TBC protein 1 isoform X1 n=1 Tax=Amblyraja radiata TaxID=386614 RepID=UPI001402EC38|nr:growth hormone-regulated TBC protein 1 isoform X1 [Amblyraja radiata]
MEVPDFGSDEERVARVDEYGFERPAGNDTEELVSDYQAVLSRRAIKWRKLLQGSRLQRSLKVKRYIRKGIPNEYRSLIWMTVSGAQGQMENNPTYYKKLLEMEEDPKLVESIRTDINRTFPDNVQFRRTTNPSFLQPLFNVLVAYGNHNKTIGYCQGMNFVAGYLLIVTKDEEKSFWLLDSLIKKIVPDFYSPTMIGLKTDQEVLGHLVRLKVPAVAELMEQHSVMWTLVVSRWFICLFIDILPVETVLRIWDCMFYEGSKITFRVALTLIKYHQASILEANNFPAICEKFKQITRGPMVQDCHGFMKKIFTEPGRLPLTVITKLREISGAQLDDQS